MHALTTVVLAIGAYPASFPAFGDLSVSAQMNISRSVSPTQSKSTRNAIGSVPIRHVNRLALYFRGSRARIELNGSLVALYNGERNRVYVLNTREHTYYSTALHGSDTFAGRQIGSRSGSPMVVFQHPSAEKRQLIAGASASRYAVYGTSESSVETSFKGSDGGGFVKINGEIWASDAVELPTTNALIVSALSSLVAYGANELQQSLQAHLLEVNEFPLRSSLVTSRLNPRSQTMETTSVAFTVSDVSRTQLSDTLFDIPSDYVQINGPATPSGGPANGSEGWRAMAGRQGGASAGSMGASAGDSEGMETMPADGGPNDGGPGGPPPGGDGGGPGGPPPAGGPGAPGEE